MARLRQAQGLRCAPRIAEGISDIDDILGASSLLEESLLTTGVNLLRSIELRRSRPRGVPPSPKAMEGKRWDCLEKGLELVRFRYAPGGRNRSTKSE